MKSKKINELTTMETVSDAANVLVEENGEAKRIPAKKLGSAISWNDLTDRPFYLEEKSITWDGNTEGLEFVDLGDGMLAYKVSDLTFAYDEVIGGFSVTGYDESEGGDIALDVSAEEAAMGYVQQITDTCCFVLGGAIIFAMEDTEIDGLLLPKGTYFMSFMYSFTAKTYHQLDAGYIPDLPYALEYSPVFYSSVSLGRKTDTEIGSNSVAMGYNVTASGSHSSAKGQNTIATGLNSHAEGYGSKAEGENSHAEGLNTTASGIRSHAEGTNTVSSGETSHAEGENTKAEGIDSHAEGRGTTVTDTATCGHAEGSGTTASNYAAHAEGSGTTASGEHSHAEGGSTVASATYTHAEGCRTKASGSWGSHAEGYETTASGQSSHAEGSETVASNNSSHAEGIDATASGMGSHAEGNNTVAGGQFAHAEGHSTKAEGNYSHSEGQGTTAKSDRQHVQGKYNIVDDANKYAHIVGNGDMITPSNAHTVDWEGNAWFAGSVEGTALILKSPNGTRFKITVSDDGVLTAAAVTE